VKEIVRRIAKLERRLLFLGDGPVFPKHRIFFQGRADVSKNNLIEKVLVFP